MKIHIITIGDELLIGQTVDTNSAWMGQHFNAIGAQMVGITTIGDDYENIQIALTRALQRADAVLLTGGLGPTKDDVTKKALADFLGVALRFDEPTYTHIKKLFERFGRATTPAHHAQSYMPENAILLKNDKGTAPGMWFDHNGKVIVSLPGVPYEMKHLMQTSVFPKLLKTFTQHPIGHRTIRTVGEGESGIAARIEAAFAPQLPPHFKIAYLPGLGEVRIRLTATGTDQAALEKQLDVQQDRLCQVLSEWVYGFEEDTLPSVLGKYLQTHNLTIATAESCTGGHLAHLITSVPGASAYYEGSIVSYSNRIKQTQLGVSEQTLRQHGAVSEATVQAMVRGALRLFKTDIAVSTSGIAGPTGGTPQKPVGTIWLAAGNTDRIITQKLRLGKDRLRNIQYTSTQALNLARQLVLEEYGGLI